jgi:hypothetical protein
MRAVGLEEVLSEAEVQEKIVYLVGIWLEALLYGMLPACEMVPSP